MDLGILMLDLAGVSLSMEDRERLKHPAVGGVILFSRNFEAPGQLAAFVAAIHALRNPPLLVAVDHEGGRVQRFREGFTLVPAAGRIGRDYDESPSEACVAAKIAGWVMASELRSIGVDFSFAPVLDLDLGMSKVIGDRSFHREPQAVMALAKAYIEGMNRAGMAATGKHFPGHGSVTADSHVAVPVDDRPLAEVRARDLVPFAGLGPCLGGIMPAHVVYSACDPLPAGFSPFWLGEVLRKEIGFQGAIFSDDLSMAGAGVLGGMRERAEAAVAAGCDMILVCNDVNGADQVLDSMRVGRSSERQRRLAAMRGRAVGPENLADEPEYTEARRVLARIA
ncbi:MAG: beta-N-acetylhexosaminidase [Acidiferrobacteraceae bacterium]